jgi:hypothetical protein
MQQIDSAACVTLLLIHCSFPKAVISARCILESPASCATLRDRHFKSISGKRPGRVEVIYARLVQYFAFVLTCNRPSWLLMSND